MLDYGDDWRWIDDLSAPRPLGLLVVLFVVLCVVAAAGAWGQAPERPKGGVVFDCGALGSAVEAMAIFRDVGADVDKTLEILFAHVKRRTPAPRWAVIEREIRRMWTEPLPGPEAGAAVYKRCQQQLGDMGRES